jgi:hypothetical protein
LNRESVAMLKIQMILRKKLRERQACLQKKTKELRQLQSLEKKELSDKQQLRMYDLRDELTTEANEVLNRKLLLRPNTSFSVY